MERLHLLHFRAASDRNHVAVMWDFVTDRGNVLFYVGTVGEIGENGIHVLDISDGDS